MVEDKDAVEPKEIADEASIEMIQCGKCSITNTMNSSTHMTGYWIAVLILSTAIQ